MLQLSPSIATCISGPAKITLTYDIPTKGRLLTRRKQNSCCIVRKKIACGIRERRISCYTNSPWSTTKWPVQRLINHYEKNTLGSKTQKLSLKNQRRQQWIRNDNAKEGMAHKDLGQFALPFTLWTAPWIKGATSIKTRHDLLICMGSQGLPSRR